MNYQDELGNWGEIILEPSGDTLPVGAITQFGGETAPTNWLFCNGQAVSRVTYKELFDAIGTTFGDGDGSTTFNVPDFSSRVPQGVGAGTDENGETWETSLGQTYGEYVHTLTNWQMPVHNHAEAIGVYNPYGSGWWGIGYLGVGQGATPVTQNVGNSDTNAGGGEAHNTVQPILGVNFIIKAKQSIGVVGTVSEDITDTNNNAVPTCETVKEYVDNKNVYSTEETVVGKAIVNNIEKPLYRKEIIISSLSNAQEINYNTSISNAELLRYEGFVSLGSNDPTDKPLPYLSPGGGATANIYYWVNKNCAQVTIKTGNDRTSASARVIIEYTKTTD